MLLKEMKMLSKSITVDQKNASHFGVFKWIVHPRCPHAGLALFTAMMVLISLFCSIHLFPVTHHYQLFQIGPNTYHSTVAQNVTLIIKEGIYQLLKNDFETPFMLCQICHFHRLHGFVVIAILLF